MAIFNSFLFVYQRIPSGVIKHCGKIHHLVDVVSQP